MVGDKFTGVSGKVYTAVKDIGSGGFGIVYLSEDETGEQYALKTLSPAAAPSVQLPFEQEINSTIGLNHPNILRVFDHGTSSSGSGASFFTIAGYCPNGDYRRVINAYAKSRPPLDSVVADFHQILDGLEVLHTKILHRDLKPENVLLSDEVKKIADFGLSKFVDEATRTLTFKGFGTPWYMAPEVWLRQSVTPATDIYAIGVMLFEALTGVTPFAGFDTIQIRDHHLFSPAPRPKSLNSSIPDPLDGVIKKMLAKDPKDRYQSAREANDALRASDKSFPASPAQEIAGRMRKHHDAREAEQLRVAEAYKAAEDAQARTRYKQVELVELFDEVMSEINSALEETKVKQIENLAGGRAYTFGNRTLLIWFFNLGELFQNPVVPGRMDELRKRHVVHGGYIKISQNGEDREGWNVALLRASEEPYGDWHLIETRVHPLVGRSKFEPIATEARLLADNLSCHWRNVTNKFVLRDKLLEKKDVYNISAFSCLRPETGFALNQCEQRWPRGATNSRRQKR